MAVTTVTGIRAGRGDRTGQVYTVGALALAAWTTMCTPAPARDPAAPPGTTPTVAAKGLRNALPDPANLANVGRLDYTGLPSTTSGLRIVATVDGRPLALRDFERHLSRAVREQASDRPGYQAEALRKVLSGAVLDGSVRQALIDHHAATHGLDVTDEEISTALTRLNRGRPPGDTVQDAAARIGQSIDDLRADVADSVRSDKVREHLGRALMPASAEQEAELARRSAAAGGGATTTGTREMRARHIVIRCPADTGTTAVETARRPADRAHDLVTTGGQDFTAVARRMSQDRLTRDLGGDLGWFAKGGRMIPVFETAAFALQPGQISPVVRSSVGFHVIQAIDRRASAVLGTYMETRRRQEFERWLGEAVRKAVVRKFL